MVEAWATAERVLCVRLDALGDVLMTTPAIRAVKESAQGRRVTLLTSPSGAAVSALVPELDQVIVYDAPWINSTKPRESSTPDYAMIERLRAEKFDAAIIFTVYSQNPMPAAFLCYMADIPLRLAHCHENPYQLLNPWIRDFEPQKFTRHEVRRQLDLVGEVGYKTADERMSLRVPDAARANMVRILHTTGIDEAGRWLLIHPGSTAASRRYRPEGFAEVAHRLTTEQGYQIVFTGDKTEVALIEGIRTAMGVLSYSLAGQLDLAEFGALIQAAPVLISNNTGPVHVAAAVGTPVVDIYALTNPQHTPWAVPNRVLNHDVPCKYCYRSVCPEGHHNCLRLVEPDDVVRATLELLAETWRGSAASTI